MDWIVDKEARFNREPGAVKPDHRREFLHALGALGVWGALGGVPRLARAQVKPRPRFVADPFSLGVASGYPGPNGAVLWTRLAPLPLAPGGGMTPESVPVQWEVAGEPGFAKIVAKGETYASADEAHSVHVDVRGLSPARAYWYRFHAGQATSPIGHFRTAPAAGARGGRLRLALASCQQYEQGYYSAHRYLAQDDPDLVVWVGDYIYESSWGGDLVRRHEGAEAVSLEDYRRRYAQYKTDADLQRSHATAAWAIGWDDHEVSNDYAGEFGEAGEHPAWFLARRAAAYKAWYEHMPVPRRMLPFGPHARIHTRINWGPLVAIHLLDDRQYRTLQACPRPGRRGSNVVDTLACAELDDPRRSMLGQEQREWLKAGLASSRARWNVIAQHSVMAQVDRKPGPGREAWTDSWDGYPLERRELLEHMAAAKTGNPIVIGGDVHMFYVNDLKPDFDDQRSPVVASEFVGTSITSQGGSQESINRMLPDNPHIKLANATQRGYTRMTFSPEHLVTDLRVMDNVRQRDGTCSTLASFAVENGRPGAERN